MRVGDSPRPTSTALMPCSPSVFHERSRDVMVGDSDSMDPNRICASRNR